MDKFTDYRSRLAALTAEDAESLAACRSLQDRLRELKREILAQLFQVRANIDRQAKRSLGPGPTLRELWDRRDEGARNLLDDVRLRVTGLLDDKDGSAAVQSWAGINQEIDARLERLAELERELASGTGEEESGVSHLTDRPQPKREEAGDDDLYAAVGAAVRKGATHGAFCSHCGQGIDSDDRFCRRCGHHL